MKDVNVLFVCLGNICRSPTAEGIFTQVVQQRGLDGLIGIDSAGTIDYHAGEPPDPRAQETARRYGIDISHLRARQFVPEDFERFQYILAMDKENLRNLELARPLSYTGKVKLLCDFAPHRKEREVPDPYYGGARGFERVYELVRDASEGLLATILEEHFPQHARSD